MFRNKFPRTIIALLVRRLALLCFALCLFSVFLYILGTRQEFTDATQLLLLRLAMVMGISLTAVSFCGLILDIRMIISRRRRWYSFAGAGGYILMGIFGAAVAVVAAFITAAAEGNLA